VPNFQYLAINSEGVKEKGQISAETSEIAKYQLKEKNLIPIKLQTRKSSFSLFKFSEKKLSVSDLSLLTRQLSVLSSGGVPLDKSLKIISEQASNSVMKEQSFVLATKIEEGFSLSEALKEFPKSFDHLYLALITAGETSGEFNVLLEKIANYLEKRSLMQKEVLAALIYPMVLVSIALVIVGLMLIFVVPSVVSQFENLNQELPLLTRWLIGLSNFISGSGVWFLLILIFGIFSLFKIGYKEYIKYIVDNLLIKMPYLSNFLIQADLSRFLSSLSIMRNNNIPIMNAIVISLRTVSNLSLQRALKINLAKIAEGESMSSCLENISYIPPLVKQMVASGEASGALEAMLAKSSDYLDQEFHQTTKIFMGLLEPLVVLIMGVIVAAIVVAVLMPLIQMNSAALLN
jgi:general secretion pathway protein F|tara:strand:+ start:1662 stop:2873 length:1212 start_codon:yes stop_codon:yes gene_type:complete